MLLAAVVAVLGNLVLLRADTEMATVQAVAADLTVGSVLAADDLVARRVPADDALGGLVHDPRDVVGLVVRNRLVAGDLVRPSDVQSPVASDATVRQLSIPIPAERAVGGLLAPDDRVDVVQVHEGAARWLVTGVRVVRVGVPDAGLGQLTAHHVVVEVDADEALCLATAMAAGGLDLVRSTGQEPLAAEGCR